MGESKLKLQQNRHHGTFTFCRLTLIPSCAQESCQARHEVSSLILEHGFLSEKIPELKTQISPGSSPGISPGVSPFSHATGRSIRQVSRPTCKVSDPSGKCWTWYITEIMDTGLRLGNVVNYLWELQAYLATRCNKHKMWQACSCTQRLAFS